MLGEMSLFVDCILEFPRYSIFWLSSLLFSGSSTPKGYVIAHRLHLNNFCSNQTRGETKHVIQFKLGISMYIVCTTSLSENVHWERFDANHPIVKHILNTCSACFFHIPGELEVFLLVMLQFLLQRRRHSEQKACVCAANLPSFFFFFFGQGKTHWQPTESTQLSDMSVKTQKNYISCP